MPDALAGLRVLDLATLYPAPLLAAMLGDLGADVVKVEPPEGDPLRQTGAMHDGGSYVWALAGRNKRSIRIDLEAPTGIDLVQQLTAVADAVVLNHPERVLERWGCTYDEIAARNPAAVVASVSAYGADGPYAGRPGNGTLAEAFGGVTHMIGEADGPPVLPSLPLGDHLGALTGVAGVLAALYWRDVRGGDGQLVDVSLVEAVLPLLGPALVAWSADQAPPARTGSRVAGAVPRNLYATADGRWVALSAATDAQVGRVLGVIGHDTDEALARFGDSASRLAHADELDGLVASWISSGDAATVVATFDDARVPVAEVNDLAGVVSNEHVRARGSVLEVEDPQLGRRRMPAPTPRLGRTPGRVPHTGPPLGHDTETVCAEWLALSDDEIAELRAAGAI